MRRPVTVSLTAALALTLLGAAGPARAGAPTGPACGATLTGAVRLTEDLACASGPGLVLTSGSTLDLGGHTLRGPGAGSDAVGVLLLGEPSPATAIRGGTVEHWGDAVAADSSAMLLAEARVQDVTFRENATALESDLGGGRYEVTRSRFVDNIRGISGAWGSVLTVTGSTFTGNDEAVHSYGGGRIDVGGSRFSANGTGISCSEQALRVTDSTFVGNDVAARGWWCKATEITGSTFRGNGTGWTSDTDLHQDDPMDLLRANRFVDNRTAVHVLESTHLVGNTFLRNGTALLAEGRLPGEMFPERFVLDANTFVRNGDAVLIPGAAADLRGNHAVRSTGHGIVAPHATDLGGNVARRNGQDPQCAGVTCARW